MTIQTEERIYSADDLWELSHSPEYANMRLELSEGRLIVMSPASYAHGKRANLLGHFITGHVLENDLGDVTGAETGFILYENPDPAGKDTVRAPDVGFVAKARLAELADQDLSKGFFPGAPDLAVEVVSPGDTADELQAKVDEYLQYGTKMIIVAYEKSKRIVVHTPSGAKTLRNEDILEGGDVLPGFAIKVSDLFK